jgi:hypothetical protein
MPSQPFLHEGIRWATTDQCIQFNYYFQLEFQIGKETVIGTSTRVWFVMSKSISENIIIYN